MDPFAPWLVALAHPGFEGSANWPRKAWWPLFDPAPPTVEELADRLGPSAAEILGRLPSVTEELDRLEANGIVARTFQATGFPIRWNERLQAKVPPVVFTSGDVSAFESKAIAIVGSRAADDNALGCAAEVARSAVERGMTVVSGGAKGVDLAAAVAATRAGGKSIVVAADSIREIQRRLARSEVDLDLVLIVTPNHPDAGFSVGQAMGRNKLIYALAEVAWVAACENGSGGTWTGALEAIRMNLCPVCSWVGPGAPPGNFDLVSQGALAVQEPAEAFLPKRAAAAPSLFD